MKRNLRLIGFEAEGTRRPLQRAACLCVLPFALVPLLPRGARHGAVVSTAPPAIEGPRVPGSAWGPGDCEQFRRAYRICLAEGSAGAVPSPRERGDAAAPPGPPAADGLLPSCDELRAGARRMLVRSTPCKL